MAPAFDTATRLAPAFGTAAALAPAFGTAAALAPAFGTVAALAPAFGTAAALALVAGTAAAQPLQWQGELALASELTDRGLSVFPRRPALQAAAQVARGRWSLAAAASTDLAGRGEHRVLARVSHYRSLSDDWQLDAGLGWYGYPGDSRARAYDRTEAGIGLGFRDVLSLNLTGIDYPAWPGRRAGLQWALEAGLRWPLGDAWSFTASIGQADLPPQPGRRYRYGGIGLAWQQGDWGVELNRLGADRTARHLTGEAARARWSALLLKSF
jgi:hypothetical protein